MNPPALKKAISMGAKVSIKEGEGIVVGVTHTQPLKFDIRLLNSGQVLKYQPQPEVTLIDHDPFNDPAIPQAYRDWLKTRPVAN